MPYTTPLSRSIQKAVALALTLGLASVGMSQTTITKDGEPSSAESQEEITVNAEKSLVRLRHAFYRAEDNLFAVFNDLNSNDDFDVNCDYVAFPKKSVDEALDNPDFASLQN